MEKYKNLVVGIIRQYKGIENSEKIQSLKVVGNEEKGIFLYPITKEYKTDIPELIEVMTRWRKENPTLSDNVFVPTVERTERWLDNSIVPDDDKILFLILDEKKNLIGHIGLCNFDYCTRCVEIYSVLRGVKNAYKGIMEQSLRTLLDWAEKDLEMEKFILSTREGNDKAIRLYEKVGFVICDKIPLKKLVLEDEVKWIPSENKTERAEKHRIIMEYRG